MFVLLLRKILIVSFLFLVLLHSITVPLDMKELSVLSDNDCVNAPTCDIWSDINQAAGHYRTVFSHSNMNSASGSFGRGGSARTLCKFFLFFVFLFLLFPVALVRCVFVLCFSLLYFSLSLSLSLSLSPPPPPPSPFSRDQRITSSLSTRDRRLVLRLQVPNTA